MRKWFVILMVITAGVFLSGCTDEEVELEKEQDQVEDVEVIDSGDAEDVDSDAEADDSEEEMVDDSADEESEDESDEDAIGDESEEGSEEEESESEESATESEEGALSVGEATAADGAAVTAYSYGIADGKLEFSWKVRGTSAKPYPKTTAKLMTDNSIVVEFESLSADYVAEEEGELDLGNLLPGLTWEPTDDGSKYFFDYESEKEFELAGEEIDGAKYIVLRVTL